MTDEQKHALFRLQAQAQALLSQIDAIWETAVQITGEPVDHFEDALCTHDFIYNGSRNPEADFELLQRVIKRKYGTPS
jgi:hypothetical protein